MRILIVVFLASVALNAFGTEESKEEFTCSDPKKLKLLCMFVGGRNADQSPQDGYRYTYQRKIFEASCVDINKDDDSIIAQKVSKVWNDNADKLVCNNLQFDVINGNIIKYAVALQFDDFLIDVIRWKVDLNKVDKSDDRTVLDYVEYQLERYKGTAAEPHLQYSYKLLRNAGAKHKREL